MATTKKTAADYAALSEELEVIITKLQADDTSIDDVLQHYERGLTILKQLEDYLQHAETKLTELQATFAAATAK